MTSKKLFLNLLADDLKGRLWPVFLAVLVFFLALPVTFLLIADHSEASREFFLHTVGYQNPFLPAVTVTGAVICALNGFSWLHSRTKVDYWHALPLRRELLFLAKYVNGILIYAAAFALNLFVTALLAAAAGPVPKDLPALALQSLLVHTSAFLLFYAAALAAVFLTGHILVNLMAAAVFFLYGTCVSYLIVSLKLTFFTTVYTDSAFSSYAGPAWISPLNAYVQLILDPGKAFWLVLGALALSALSFLLYRMRPSEAAGQAIAFPCTKPFIKLLTIVPLALGGGLFFRALSVQSGTAWFCFGAALLWLAGSIFLEALFALDFRQALSHKGSSLACLAAVVCIVTVLRMDLFGYDTYLPKKSSVESMAIYTSCLDSSVETYEKDRDGSGYYNYVSPSDYRLSRMEITDLTDIYALAEAGAADAGLHHRGLTDEALGSSTFSCVIKFRLKNGREVCRRYHFPMQITENGDENFRHLSRLYRSEEYKRGSYPILTRDGDPQFFDTVSVTDRLGHEQRRPLGRRQMDALQEALRRELSSRTLEETFRPSVGSISLCSQEFFPGQDGRYALYADDAAVLALLEEYGLTPGPGQPPANTSRAEITVEYFPGGTAATAEPYASGTPLAYERPEELRAVFPCLIPKEGNAPFFYDFTQSGYYGACLYLYADNGSCHVVSFYLDTDRAPDFLLEDLGLLSAAESFL